ncbi:MAG: hypothetical protein MI747_13800 [Desulfobacterales bacterium]|nr:hypothetical protein [Desulfobacterales bacterium]
MIFKDKRRVKACCTKEKKRLMDELRVCDYGTTSPEERHLCYREAARQSGRRARTCISSL